MCGVPSAGPPCIAHTDAAHVRLPFSQHGVRCDGGLFLLRVHADIDTYEMVACVDLKAEAKALLDHEYTRLLAERDAAAAVRVRVGGGLELG